MPKWLDELEAQPDEDPRKRVILIVLAVLALGVMAWQFQGRGPAPPPPPPAADVYRAAVTEVASAEYVGSRLEITVDKRWYRLSQGDRTDRLVLLGELTGSFEYERMVVRDTDGAVVATVASDGKITWVDAPQ